MPNSSGPCTLREGEVHVWRFSLDRKGGSLLELSPDEEQKSGRFRSPVDRDRFAVARGTLRKILGRYLDLMPQQVRFSYNRYGKPSLDHAGSAIRFNLTHSRDVAYAAVTIGREIGIDVEFVDRDFPVMETARRAFSAAEYAQFCSTPPALQTNDFFRRWTRNEALLKALGTGFAREPIDIGAFQKWTVTSLSIEPEYKAALAVEGMISGIDYRSYDQENWAKEWRTPNMPFGAAETRSICAG